IRLSGSFQLEVTVAKQTTASAALMCASIYKFTTMTDVQSHRALQGTYGLRCGAFLKLI
ncbi:hypothetical protein PILCRDRAFT_820829, partial [Piloderma croceum F 1598]